MYNFVAEICAGYEVQEVTGTPQPTPGIATPAGVEEATPAD